ncbi:hypothetical protein ACFQWB_01230 [Paenibacillus thermoaerophilus]|uniref:Translation initiation factor IF-2 n=1 Tax=Paenibacillus thermoaerophilus TaxID=1215385 RepID=A0ABW2UXE7_9BACL|nr:hypothetical protein [Paenibacillus thermoaerophilus]TMV18988.1 hypothetical protein FE781_00255 [Paenibacillus thermoaerophilus]
MRTGRSTLQVFIVMILAAFGVFFGIDIATRGLEQVNGQMPQTEAGTQAVQSAVPRGERVRPSATPTPRVVAPALRVTPPPTEQEEDVYPPEPAIAQFGNSVGDLLHHSASLVVNGVSSIFSKLTD